MRGVGFLPGFVGGDDGFRFEVQVVNCNAGDTRVCRGLLRGLWVTAREIRKVEFAAGQFFDVDIEPLDLDLVENPALLP